MNIKYTNNQKQSTHSLHDLFTLIIAENYEGAMSAALIIRYATYPRKCCPRGCNKRHDEKPNEISK